MTSNASLLGASILLVVLLAAYGYLALSKYEQPAQNVMIANPAAAHCVSLGGAIDIRADAAGAETGYCILPDGRVCEEWSLLRENTCLSG